MSGKYPTTFYRVSLKAIIYNDKGEILVVKDKGGDWTLPGGGMDHGETVHEALKRELYEEVLLTSDFTEQLVDSESMYLERHEAWLLWLVFIVESPNISYGLGEDADDVAFVKPDAFKDSPNGFEQLTYKFGLKYNYHQK